MNGTPEVDSDSLALVHAKLHERERALCAAHLALVARIDALLSDTAHQPQECWLSWSGKLLVFGFVAACAGTGYCYLVASLVRDLLAWLT